MLDDVNYDEGTIHVESGDAIFLYTDGLFSCGLNTDFTNWTQVEELADRYKDNLKTYPDDFLEDIFYAFHLIHREKHSDFTDDVALMLLKIK